MSIGRTNRVFIFAVFLWLLASSESLAAPVTGLVRDKKTKEAVAGAFVLVFSDKTQKGFVYSDADGCFSVPVQEGVSVNILKVSMMGYAPATIYLEGRTSDIIVELEEQTMQLQASSVRSGPIRHVGDTLSFYAQAFSDGTEKVLGELLGKIPGISVNSSGTIMHDGEAINRFYVEGMDLMGRKYGVVTNNLKASDIARVDVYLNHQPIRALEDISYSDRSAVNIVLKESSKGSWFFTGDALMGFPTFSLFDSKAMISRFSKNSQDLYLAKGNNLGIDIVRELMDQPGTGDVKVIVLKEGSMDNQFETVLSPSFSSLPIPREYWYDNTSGIATFNHLSKIGEFSRFRLSFNAASERYKESALSSELIKFEDGTSITIDDHRKLDDRNWYINAKGEFEENSSSRYMMESLSFSGQIRGESSSGEGYKEFNEKYDLPSMKVENRLHLTQRQGKHAIDILSTSSYIRNNHSATYDVGGKTYRQEYGQNDILSEHSVSLELKQGIHSFKANFLIGLDYIGRRSDLIGSSIDEPLKADLSLVSFRPGVTISDAISLGKVTFTAGLPLSLHYLHVEDRKNLSYLEMSPYLSAQYRISSALEAKGRISYDLSHSSMENLLDAVVMRNYRFLSRPDSISRHDGIRANASLKYSDPVKMFFMGASAAYSRSVNEKTASNYYTEEFSLSKYLPLPTVTSMFMANYGLRKYFGGANKLMLEGICGFDRMSMEEYLQSAKIDYTTSRSTIGLVIRSTPLRWFSLNIKTEYTKQITESSASSVKSYMLTGEGSLRISPLKRLDLDLDGYVRREQIPGVSVYNRPLLKGTVSWKLSKGSIVYIQCRNILDINHYSRETISSYRIISSINKLRGRQYLAGIRMSF